MSDSMLYIDTIRFITGFSILFYASYTDIKTRMAPNILWIIMGGIGAVLLLFQFFIDGFSNQTLYLIFIPIMIGLVYLFFQLRLIFGGADAKALMAIAILTPFQPFQMLSSLPLHPSFMPFSWVIFSNSIFLFLLIPLSLFILNVIKGDIQFPHCFFGYKVTIEKAKKTFVWPLERFKNGDLKFSYVPTSFDPSDQIELFEKKGFKELWVTPKIPFMIPLIAGFITGFFYGDILTAIMQFFIT
jgi:archaeal preflagellin peptidase FlaK